MVQVVIVGPRDSGKTTFLGLLYAALVKSGSDKRDGFRFHAAFESLEEIAAVFQGLMSGSFPDAATKEGLREVSFRLGSRGPALRILPILGSRARASGASASFRFVLMRTPEEEVPRFLKGSTFAHVGLRDVLDADAVVIMVDSRELAVDNEDPQRRAIGTYDGAVEALLTAIQGWQRDGRRLLFPAFILSKFDRVGPEVLRGVNVEDTPPPASKHGRRAAYAEALLEHNLPRTLAKTRARGRDGLKFAMPAYFFSWVRTEVAGPGKSERIRLRRSEGSGWEPDYSSGEYMAFVEYLREIAVRTRA